MYFPWFALLFLDWPVDLSGDAEAKPVQTNKAGGVVLVVSFGGVSFHRGDLRIVKAHGRLAARRNYISLVELHAHRAADILLALRNEGLQGISLRRKPITVVD